MKLIVSCIFASSFLLVSQVYAKGNATKGAELYKICIQCHGDKGQGVQAEEAPMLAGQFDWYIVAQLKAFQEKTRSNPKMYPFIEKLSSTDFEDLAAYISKLR